MSKKESLLREEIKKRLRYLNTELAHERYHDGWVIQGMKEEKKLLEKQLEKLDDK